MDLGPHAAFIWSSYAIVGVTIAVLIAWLYADGRRQGAALKDLEARGVKRRTAGPGKADDDHAARSL
jgi:heme exporter protein D